MTNKHDYSKDKKGWVTFKSGKKVKLRKYLSDVALAMSKHNNDNFIENKKFIIKKYEAGGLPKVHEFLREMQHEIIKQLNNVKNEN